MLATLVSLTVICSWPWLAGDRGTVMVGGDDISGERSVWLDTARMLVEEDAPNPSRTRRSVMDDGQLVVVALVYRNVLGGWLCAAEVRPDGGRPADATDRETFLFRNGVASIWP